MPANAFGQREPTTSHVDPPGTCLFDPPEAEDVQANDLLKRHPKNHQIILRPQPGDSPKDPLNWSRVRKEVRSPKFATGGGQQLIGSACSSSFSRLRGSAA